MSFETLEHVAEQDEMLAELNRVLRPDGFVIISTPNRIEYSDKRGFQQRIPRARARRPEFRALLGRYFDAQRWYGQRLLFNSGVWPLDVPPRGRPAQDRRRWVSVTRRGRRSIEDDQTALPAPMYFVALAAATMARLPDASTRATLLAIRTTRSTASTNRRYRGTRRLEQLVTERELIVIERDAQIAGLDAAKAQLEIAIIEPRAAIARAPHRAGSIAAGRARARHRRARHRSRLLDARAR